MNPFSCMIMNDIFKTNLFSSILVGHTDGKISILKNSTDTETIVETKGTGIQCMLGGWASLGSDGTGSSAGSDLIAGDSSGHVTIFHNGHILMKHSISPTSITALTINRDTVNDLSIVVGDMEGVLTALQPQEQVWRVRVFDSPVHPATGEMIPQENEEFGVGISHGIRCLFSVSLCDRFGVLSNYILAGDSTNHLYFYNQGTHILTLPTSSPINTICQGFFTTRQQSSNQLSDNNNLIHLVKRQKLANNDKYDDIRDGNYQDLVVGCDDGLIYLLQNFQLIPFIRVGHPVTVLKPFHPTPTRSSYRSNLNDYLLCAGHFNGLKIYFQGKLVGSWETSDWVHSIDVGDIDHDHINEIVVGTLNSTLFSFKLLDVCNKVKDETIPTP